MMELNFDIRLTRTQTKAYSLLNKQDTQILVCRWSRQCGKSVFAQLMLIKHLCLENRFSAYISPTFSLGRKVFKELVQMLEGTGIIKQANASTLTITSIANSTIQFFSIEAYTAIRGFTVSGILILDEAAFYPTVLPSGEDIWGSIIMPITKARKPKILIISTPRGKQGLFYDMYLKAISDDPKYKKIKQVTATIYDDTLVSAEDIEDIKNSIPERSWREEFMVEFLDSSGTFFQGYEKCFKQTSKLYKKTWIGVDLSSEGSDATILTKINENNEVECIPIIGTLDNKYRLIADYINTSTNVQRVYIEENGLGTPMINEILKLVRNKSLVTPWLTTNTSKEEIVSDLAVEIAKENITFDEKDTQLYTQLGAFVCKLSKTKKLIFGGGAGHHDDMVMATAIALRAKKDYNYSSAVFFNKKITVGNLN